MKDDILIIGDIAGRYDELMELIHLAKEEYEEFSIISVGDMVDRGSQSNQVVSFFKGNKDAFAIKGNHEDMMIDACLAHKDNVRPEYDERFGWSVWRGNGGQTTIDSYGTIDDIPNSHIMYLRSLPLFIEHCSYKSNIVVTHAPINPVYGLEELKTVHSMEDHSLCWNRGIPDRMKGVELQFHGHEARRDIVEHTDDIGVYAINVDTSRGGKLTGMMYPSMDVFSVPYKEKV